VGGIAHQVGYSLCLRWRSCRHHNVAGVPAAVRYDHRGGGLGDPYFVDHTVTIGIRLMTSLQCFQQSVLVRIGEISAVPGDALAILNQRGHAEPGIHQRGVLAADQRAERRAQHPFQVGRLEDDGAQGVPQLIKIIHASRHYAIGPCRLRPRGGSG